MINPKYAAVAQGLERHSYKVVVGGSNPPCRTYARVAQWIRAEGFYPSGRRFESCRECFFKGVFNRRGND